DCSHCCDTNPIPSSIPTRRSSDLDERLLHRVVRNRVANLASHLVRFANGINGVLARSVVLEGAAEVLDRFGRIGKRSIRPEPARSEEHTSELQSLRHLVCRLLLEK